MLRYVTFLDAPFFFSHFHPPSPLGCLQLIPTRSSLIGPIIGSGVANSAEIIGCWETKGGLEVLKGGLGRVRCAWRATRKLVCQSEMNFSPYVELFSPPPPPPLLIFFGGPGLGLRGSGWVCFLWQRQVSKCSVFESERGKERGKKNLLQPEFSCGGLSCPR